MSPKVSIVSTDAAIKSAEFGAVVTVGNPVTAAKLSKALGRKVEIGEQIDLGTVATYNRDPFKNWVQNVVRFVRRLRNPAARALSG